MYSACFGRKYRCPIESMVFDVFCVFWADVPISDRKRCFRSTASLRARSRAVSRRAPSLAAGTPHLPRRFRPYGVSRHLLRRLTWLGRYWAAIAVANPHGMLRFGSRTIAWVLASSNRFQDGAPGILYFSRVCERTTLLQRYCCELDSIYLRPRPSRANPHGTLASSPVRWPAWPPSQTRHVLA